MLDQVGLKVQKYQSTLKNGCETSQCLVGDK
jgi:hypothetical protein